MSRTGLTYTRDNLGRICPTITHGGVRFLKTGVLPAGKEHIARMVDGIVAEYVEDLGGEQHITAAQQIILQQIRQQLVFLRLVDEWIAQQPGIVDDRGRMLGPLCAFYLATSNNVVRYCRELGLRRVHPGALTMEQYLDAKARDAEEPGQGDAQAEALAHDAPAADIVAPGVPGEGK